MILGESNCNYYILKFALFVDLINLLIKWTFPPSNQNSAPKTEMIEGLLCEEERENISKKIGFL